MNHTNRCCIFFGGLFSKSGHMSDDWSHIRWAIQLYLTNTILICCYNLLDTWTKAKFPIKYVRQQSNSLSNKYFAPNQSLRDKYKNYCNSSITERLIAPECDNISLMIVGIFKLWCNLHVCQKHRFQASGLLLKSPGTFRAYFATPRF